jgi:hypothetical protein
MAMKNKFSLYLALSLSFLTACGPRSGFNVAQQLAGNSANDKTGDTETSTFSANDLSGTANGGPANNMSIIVYDVSEKAIQIRIPMAGVIGSVDTVIPNVPGSRVFFDNTNPFLPILVVSVPGMYVLGKLGFDEGDVGLDPTLLPNGQPIPFTPGGEPPRISFLIPNISRTVQVYLGINVVAVYVDLPVDPMADLTFPIRNKSKSETIGYFATVRRRAPANGGFFVSLIMPPVIAGALDDHLRKVIVP